jgi:hypothetical protein
MNRPPYREPPPPARPASQRLDGWTRLLIVGGAVAAVTWFAWPYVRGDIANLASQLDGGRRERDGLPPAFDWLGVMPRAEAEQREDGRRRRHPDREDRYSDREERYPDRRRESRQDRQWHRECHADGWGRLTCGPQQDGDLPPRGRR